MALRRAGRGYVLGVNSTHQFNSWSSKLSVSGTAEAIGQGLDASAWQRLSAGEGTKGPRLYDWAYLELADLDADEFSKALCGTWTRGLLVRRNLADGALAYFTTWCSQGTGIDKLVQVEGSRWSIEDSFETAKNELGLDHNETRSWHGWHRHVSLVMLAFAMMATIRQQANATALDPNPPVLTRAPRLPSAGRSRRSAVLPPASRKPVSAEFHRIPGRPIPQAHRTRTDRDGVTGPRGGPWAPTTINGNRHRRTGVLNNELYVGRLVWNRLRYSKDPDTGTRRSRPNDTSAVVTTEVPGLRVIDEELWAAVRARQARVNHRSTTTAEEQPSP